MNILEQGWYKNRALVVLLCTAVICTSFFCGSWVTELPPVCPMRLAIGIPCPACGFTRSFCAISHGKFLESISFHVFGPGLFLVMVLAIPLSLIEIIRKQKIVAIHKILFSRIVAHIFAASLIGYHSLRLGWLLFSGNIFNCVSNSILGKIVGMLA